MNLTNIRTLIGRRLIWFLAPVIMLPLLIILIVQYRSLRTLEKTLPAHRRDVLSEYLRVVISDITRLYRVNAERLLAIPLPAPEAKDAMPEGKARALSVIARATEHFKSQENFRGASRLFVAIANEDQGEMRSEVFFYNPARQTLEPDPQAKEMRAINVACAPYLIYIRMGSVIQPDAAGNERDPAVPLILKPITDGAQRTIGLAGMTLDLEWFKNEAVSNAVKQTLPKWFSGEDQEAAVSLCDGLDRVVWSTHEVPNTRPDAAQRFQALYTRYSLGVRMRNLSVEQWARRNFLLNLSLSLVMALMLLSGLLLGLRAAMKEIKLSQMKTDFVANVSHEFRTPLTSICALSEMMKYDRVKNWDKVREYGDHINAQGRRLTQLVNNILDFSRLESGQRVYRFEQADVRGVVDEALEAVAMQLKQSGHNLRFEAEQPLPPVCLDADALALALSNLLDNAIKYSSNGTEIILRLQRDEDMILISVTDQGIGIPREEREKIFEKFYRVSTGLVHDVKGSGLGLAIVRHIVKAHQGQITVRSEPKRGSTFTICLPIASDHSNAAAQQVKEEQPCEES